MSTVTPTHHVHRFSYAGNSIPAINQWLCLFCGDRHRESKVIMAGGQCACESCARRYGFPRRPGGELPEVVIVEYISSIFQFYTRIDGFPDSSLWLRRYTSDAHGFNREEVGQEYRDRPGAWIVHYSNECGALPHYLLEKGKVL